MFSCRSHFSSIFTDVLVALIVLLGATVFIQHNSVSRLAQQNEYLKAEKRSAESVAQNFIKATLLFNNMARVTEHDNQTQRDESERRVVVIRTLAKGNNCSSRTVPADAVDQLRAHRNQIH